MSNTNAPADGSTTPHDSMLQQRLDTTAASSRTAESEAEALLQSQYRALAAGANPFAGTAALGLGAASMAAINPFLFQQDMLRREELGRTIASAAGLALPGHDLGLDALGLREAELIRLRNAQLMGLEADLAARAGAPMPTAGLGSGSLLNGSAVHALGPRSEGINRQRAPDTSSSEAAPSSQGAISSEVARLSAEDRDRLREVADQTYQNALRANGLPASGLSNALQGSDISAKNIGDKALAQEALLHDNVQRRLMEQEALVEQEATQKKQQAAAIARNQALMGGTNFDLERAELIRRHQQEELNRLIQMQQFQLPGEDLLSWHSMMRGAAAMPTANPYTILGVLPQVPLIPPAARMYNPQLAAANMEKACSAEGTPENDIIAKFLNVVTSRVPEIVDILAYFFPMGLVNNPEKFRAEFPGVVEATLAELKLMQDRASKENGYKSRGFYDRLTNCIAAIAPYRNVTTGPTGVAMIPGIQNVVGVGQNSILSSNPLANMSATKTVKGREFSLIDTWTCHKCGNDNMASKARCSTCQGWKGGVRENKPKKRKQTADGSGKNTKDKGKRKKKKATDDEMDAKKGSKESSTESVWKPNHILLQKCVSKSPKDKPATTKTKGLSLSESTSDKDDKKTAESKEASNVKSNESSGDNGEDHIDAANVLLGLSGSE